MSTDFLNIAGIFKINTDLFKKTLQGIPPERLLTRPARIPTTCYGLPDTWWCIAPGS